jgi:hypothetical protein
VISTTFDVLGLAALVAGVLILAGLGFALIVACPCLMFIGWGIKPEEDRAAVVALARARARVRRALGAPRRLRASWSKPKAVA